MENLEIWNRLATPPPDALKTIQAGRLKGKSDISPQWRYKALTEEFGVCGDGWKFTVDRLWNEPGSHDQVFAFACVSLYVRVGEQWSDAIPGCGGSMLVDKESSGLYSSDEGYKMAITDALGTAAKMVGVAANVYLNNMDGSKYNRPADAPKSTPKAESKEKPPATDKPKFNPADKQWLDTMAEQKKEVGEQYYYEILKGAGFNKSNEVKERDDRLKIFTAMRREYMCQQCDSRGVDPEEVAVRVTGYGVKDLDIAGIKLVLESFNEEAAA